MSRLNQLQANTFVMLYVPSAWPANKWHDLFMWGFGYAWYAWAFLVFMFVLLFVLQFYFWVVLSRLLVRSGLCGPLSRGIASFHFITHSYWCSQQTQSISRKRAFRMHIQGFRTISETNHPDLLLARDTNHKTIPMIQFSSIPAFPSKTIRLNKTKSDKHLRCAPCP